VGIRSLQAAMASHRRCNISTAIRSQHDLEGVLGMAKRGFAMSDVVSKNLLVTALDRTLSGML
jgi:hypothetical protein